MLARTSIRFVSSFLAAVIGDWKSMPPASSISWPRE